MTPRDNLLSLLRREGYETAPVQFHLCPSLVETMERQTGETDYHEYFQMPWRHAGGIEPAPREEEVDWSRYFDPPLGDVLGIDHYGVAQERGSEAAKHMTHMRHPLAGMESVEELEAYPWPDFENAKADHLHPNVEAIHARGLAAMAVNACTVWEGSWYMRGMENLMMDMVAEDEMATFILDRITADACHRVRAYAAAGTDVIHLGDDIGSQSTLLMSPELYRAWIKPRLRRVVEAAREAHPSEVIISYHSCGYVTPLIDDLIEAGIDVLNPVQPESMDFAEIHETFGDRLSFWGTVGTQSTMPFGTPAEVRETVQRNLAIAGPKGGLFCAPTHLLEPEVPWDNILAYVDACRTYRPAASRGGA